MKDQKNDEIVKTPSDELLGHGDERREARAKVADAVSAIMKQWKSS